MCLVRAITENRSGMASWLRAPRRSVVTDGGKCCSQPLARPHLKSLSSISHFPFYTYPHYLLRVVTLAVPWRAWGVRPTCAALIRLHHLGIKSRWDRCWGRRPHFRTPNMPLMDSWRSFVTFFQHAWRSRTRALLEGVSFETCTCITT